MIKAARATKLDEKLLFASQISKGREMEVAFNAASSKHSELWNCECEHFLKGKGADTQLAYRSQ